MEEGSVGLPLDCEVGLYARSESDEVLFRLLAVIVEVVVAVVDLCSSSSSSPFFLPQLELFNPVRCYVVPAEKVLDVLPSRLGWNIRQTDVLASLWQDSLEIFRRVFADQLHRYCRQAQHLTSQLPHRRRDLAERDGGVPLLRLQPRRIQSNLEIAHAIHSAVREKLPHRARPHCLRKVRQLEQTILAISVNTRRRKKEEDQSDLSEHFL